ncbi:hypothetical protein GOP47_0001904 [Adiantum capillus-veneris]|uniref:Uncharacterized protein n=1 Tax=Adiantum capillus-veneris TaxID=13818 RepID=A0A9D4VAG9_ADICA|nr:hypothetical protein GOP47_0001904 [Adiantum capillus-veneris]
MTSMALMEKKLCRVVLRHHYQPLFQSYRNRLLSLRLRKLFAERKGLASLNGEHAGRNLLHTVRRQEMAWENAEADVHKLDRRLRVLERSNSFNKAPQHMIHDNASSFAQLPTWETQGSSPVPMGPYSCIYVSPIYDDKRGSIMYRTQFVEDGGHGLRSRSFAERIRDDEKDLEIKRLRLDLQRQDLEMRRLKAELHKLRALEFEDERNVISDKYVDKVNTVNSSGHTLSRPQSNHEALQHVKADLSSSHSTSEGPVDSSKGHAHNPLVDGQGNSDSRCGTPRRSNLSLQGSFRSMRESLARRGRREHVRAPSVGLELERCVSASDCSNSSSMVQQLISSLFSTMQASVENLCNNIKMREPRDTDSSKIDSGAIDDELFILKKTLSRLQDVCQESFNCETRNHQVESEKGTIDGMLHQLAQAEFKVIALESSFVEKERRAEDLESQVHAVLKEREALMIEKYELTNVIREMQQEAAEQRHRIEELLSINEELLEISQAEEDKLGTYQETRDKLLQQVVQYEDNCVNFECLLQEKEKELDDLNRRLKAGQIGADSIIFEKFELLGKIQAIQTESEEQKKRIDELVSINEELLEFAQSKEDQLAYMGKELDRLQAGECKERGEVNSQVEANTEESSKVV